MEFEHQIAQEVIGIDQQAGAIDIPVFKTPLAGFVFNAVLFLDEQHVIAVLVPD